MIQLHPLTHPFSVINPYNGESVRRGWPKRPYPLFSAPFMCVPSSQARALPLHCAKSMVPSRPPISKLPVELLSMIFMLSCEPDASDPGVFNASSVKIPLILSHVCHHWRTVARNTPRLWTQICITRDLLIEDDKCNPRVETSLISTYLALSRDYPLDIRIDVRDEDWDGTEPEIEDDDPNDICDPESTYNPDSPVFACSIITNSLILLIPHLHRWKSLVILTDTWAPMFLALNLINPCLTKFGAPRLESLTLMRCNEFVCFNPTFEPKHLVKPEFLSRKKLTDDAGAAPDNGSSAVNLFPRLKHLDLKGVHVDWEALADAMEANAVGGLKTLCLRSLSEQVTPSQTTFLRLLNASPSLETLAVKASGPSPLSDSQTSDRLGRARLDKLQRLEIGYRSAEEAEALIGSISTSTVREVVLEYETSLAEDFDDTEGELVLGYLMAGGGQPFLEFSGVEDLTLESVGFDHRSTGRKALRSVLTGATGLKRLNVVDMAVEDVLQSLVPEGTGHPCPELTSLTMSLNPFFQSAAFCVPNGSITALLEMIKHLEERRDISSLRELKIDMERFHPFSGGAEKSDAIIGETFVSISLKSVD